jgi:NNP family nitrate/nitrite transporter-like MFS transporter
MNLTALRKSGHWPTLLTAFLYFDFSFMVWTVLGPLGAQIGEALHLNDAQKGLMVAVPTLSGAFLRILLGLLVDRIGGKNTGLISQLIVMGGLAYAWLAGLSTFGDTLFLGALLGFAGASFAVALPQAGRWYPPNMQGVVMGLAGAGNVGVVLDSLIAPRVAQAYGWQAVFGLALIPAVIVFVVYLVWSKDAPVEVKRKKLSDYWRLLRDKDAHWFCFYYTVSFGGFVGLATCSISRRNSAFPKCTPVTSRRSAPSSVRSRGPSAARWPTGSAAFARCMCSTQSRRHASSAARWSMCSR